MGRKKLKIFKLECMKARQVKYSKRKFGVLKKAKELSVLCDVDVGLLMFSPTSKPSIFVGHNKSLSSLLERLSCLSVEEREERRDYTMKLLKKMYSKSGSDVDQDTLSIDRDEAIKLEKHQLLELQGKLAEKKRILREWKNPYNVDNFAQIKIMEDHLIATLERLKTIKIELREKHNKK